MQPKLLIHVIYGLDLRRGDEVIGTKQDYPNMINAWRQRALREGIQYTQLSFDFPIEDDEHHCKSFRKSHHPQNQTCFTSHM